MAERERRRLTTILAADVAGYSRLTGADEEGTLRRLRQLRAELFDPAIEGNGGRVFKRTGDGILAEFASVVDAVRCALAVQQGLAARNSDTAPQQRIEVRVGIHLGDVIVEDDGDLMGDGVNIAARLEGIAAPGGISLSRAAHDQVEGKVAAEFRDIGEQELKNIARPIRVFAIDPSAAAPQPSAPVLATPPRLSIVVLPFANIGGDPEQDYFVDGVTESLTTDLSRLAGSFVIARNTAFTFKGKPYDVTKIGRELNVRYVLEGSVQRGGSRMRVNVQLIDAESGAHLWAERFDKPVGDLFDMQDEIVARLANQLSVELIAVEARRAAKSPNPDSMDLYFQGRACSAKGRALPAVTQARQFFEQAVAHDPENVDALVWLAHADFMVAAALSEDGRDRLAESEKNVLTALSLAPDHAFAHLVLGIDYVWSNRAAEAIGEFEHAIMLDRNLAHAHSYIGQAKAICGRPEETEAHVLDALRISPRDNRADLWMMFVGNAKLMLGADEEAVAWLRRSIEANRSFPIAHFHLAAALGHLGRIAEARAAVQAGLALSPGATIARNRLIVTVDSPIALAGRERIYDGMRLAGMTEE